MANREAHRVLVFDDQETWTKMVSDVLFVKNIMSRLSIKRKLVCVSIVKMA